MRECRIKVYGQFLEAYKSVMVGTMAASFGVGSEFLDAELSRFIAAGKLHAKIDKVCLGRTRFLDATVSLLCSLCISL